MDPSWHGRCFPAAPVRPPAATAEFHYVHDSLQFLRFVSHSQGCDSGVHDGLLILSPCVEFRYPFSYSFTPYSVTVLVLSIK